MMSFDRRRLSRKLSRRASTSERGVTEKDVPPTEVKDKLIEEEEAQIGSVSKVQFIELRFSCIM